MSYFDDEIRSIFNFDITSLFKYFVFISSCLSRSCHSFFHSIVSSGSNGIEVASSKFLLFFAFCMILQR
jgi:hypothetical protein